MKTIPAIGSLIAALLAVSAGHAAPPEVNYDESKVPAYTLPELLKLNDGAPVTTPAQWREKRRPEILELYRAHVFGRSPGRPAGMKFETVSVVTNALGGAATRKEVTIWLTGRSDGPYLDLLLYLPNGLSTPAPAFLGLNFKGNHAVASERDVRLCRSWMRRDPKTGITNNAATEASRGTELGRWPIGKIIARGYAVATACYNDLEPDDAQGWKIAGVRKALSPEGAETVFKPDDWGAIGAWAWGLSRALDYLETDAGVDAKRVAVLGHSRLGKTSLWAGAQDERFAIVISNDSGEGGAAITRRRFGEKISDLNRNFPHWFCGAFKQYDNREDALPVDAHMLIALAAPRPAYVASATEDQWADPKGEFLAAKGAGPIYRLFGLAGLGVEEQPAPDTPVGDAVGYHLRTGRHDLAEYDWERYMDFADRHWKTGSRSAK